MADDSTFGSARPIQIVKVDDELHKFYLSEEDLSRLMLQDHVRNRDVVIVSVAGAFRKGKSFMLDFFLRYLYANVSSRIFFISCNIFIVIFLIFFFSTFITVLRTG